MPVHGDGQGVVINEVPAAVPQPFQQLLAGQDLPGMGSEGFQQLVLIGGDRQLFCPPHGGQGRKIQRQPAVAPFVRSRCSRGAARPAKGHFHSPQQNLHIERLRYIVLSPHIEAVEDIVFQVVGRQKNHWQIRLGLLELSAKIKAVAIRQVYIQKYQIQHFMFQQVTGLCTVVGCQRSITSRV